MTDAKRLNTLITELGQVCAIVLANEPSVPKELRRVLTLFMNHEPMSRHALLRLDNMLRSTESDLELCPALRLAMSVLLMAQELAPRRPRSKSPAETQLEQG